MGEEENTLESLVMPTDAEILNQLTHGKRETPTNLAAQLNDIRGNYCANRLRALKLRGYTHSPGPAERSGMYEITTWGRFAAAHIDRHDRPYDDLFHRLVARTVSAQEYPDQDTSDPDTGHPFPDPDAQTETDWIQLYPHEILALQKLADVDGVTIPTDFRRRFEDENGDVDMNANDAAARLYTLYFYGLADRHDGMEAYSITDRGREVLDAGLESTELQHGIPITRITEDN